MNNTHLNFKTVRRCNYVDILVLVLLPCVSTVSFHLASVDRCLKLRPILLTTPLCRLLSCHVCDKDWNSITAKGRRLTEDFYCVKRFCTCLRLNASS